MLSGTNPLLLHLCPGSHGVSRFYGKISVLLLHTELEIRTYTRSIIVAPPSPGAARLAHSHHFSLPAHHPAPAALHPLLRSSPPLASPAAVSPVRPPPPLVEQRSVTHNQILVVPAAVAYICSKVPLSPFAPSRIEPLNVLPARRILFFPTPIRPSHPPSPLAPSPCPTRSPPS